MPADPNTTAAAIKIAVLAERERIAQAIEAEADLTPCEEDAQVERGLAWLVRADFSYEEAERLQLAAEHGGIADGE